MKAPRQICAAFTALALLAACGGETTSPATQLARLELRSHTRAIAVGYFTTIEAVAYDQHNATMATPVLSWSSDDPTIATVDARGVVTGQGIGEVTIRASSGVFEGTLRIAVKASRVVIRTDAGTPVLVIGESVVLESQVLDVRGRVIEKHPPLTWVTADPELVTLDAVPELGPSFVRVSARSTGLASISVGAEGMENVFIVGVIPEPVPADAPLRISSFFFLRYSSDFASYSPFMAIAVERNVTVTRVEIALPSMVSKGLPPLCSNGRLSAGIHELLSGTSYPLAALYTYAHIDVYENYGVALLTYRTEEGREIHTVVRGAIDTSIRDSGYVTHFPWQLCTS